MAAITLRPSQSTYISSWYPDQNFSSSTALFAGRFKEKGDVYRSLLQFNLDRIPLISTIDNAQLNLYMSRNQVGAGGAYIRVQRLFTSWAQDKVNWKNQPDTTPTGFNWAWDASVYISPSTSNGLVSIDISDLVRKWVHGSIPNHGLQLAGNELKNSLVGFLSPNSPYTYTGPGLTVNLELGLLGIYDRQDLLIPGPPADPVVACNPINLGPGQMATFMVENTSSSTSVEARLEVGSGSEYSAAGPWHSIEACGNMGATIALSTGYHAQQARVLLRGAGGEIIVVTPRSRE
ncbi:MAG TPA: DNRLRE domain-containing protein [Syntrophomonadaceae bacterium]|nr:DNRLRE domain-containing protein [Syntrophomonadaceae bacterium]